MSAGAVGRVIFRRIRGHLVPIVQKAGSVVAKAGAHVGSTAAAGARGAAKRPGSAIGFGVGAYITTMFAGMFGGGIGRSMAGEARTKLTTEMKRGERVDAKTAYGATGIKNVTIVTSAKDVEKAFAKEPKNVRDYAQQAKDKQHLSILATQGTKNNAFAMRYKGKDYVFVSEKVNKHVLGHELGHIQDYRKNGTPGYFGTGLTGMLTGATLRREERAWELSPFKAKNAKEEKEKAKLRDPALTTYSRPTRGTQIGGGAAAGAMLWRAAKILGRAA